MSAAEAARAGRPRSAAADDAILDAATELFCEVGYDGLSVEAVAARAGVGKTTIYRRYDTKLDLVMAALRCVAKDAMKAPETGSLRTDLLALAEGYHRMLTSTTAGRAIPMTLAAKAQNPEMAAAHDEFVQGRRRVAVTVIDAGIARGELPAGIDATLIADALTGALFMRVFVTGQPVDAAYREQLIDLLLGGRPAS
jgi:AcrR family transcriptional regulator